MYESGPAGDFILGNWITATAEQFGYRFIAYSRPRCKRLQVSSSALANCRLLGSPAASSAVLPDFASATCVPKGSPSQQPCPGTALPLRSV